MVERSPLAHGLKDSPNVPEGKAGLCAYATAHKLHRARYQGDLSRTVENVTNLGENHIKYIKTLGAYRRQGKHLSLFQLVSFNNTAVLCHHLL